MKENFGNYTEYSEPENALIFQGSQQVIFKKKKENFQFGKKYSSKLQLS